MNPFKVFFHRRASRELHRQPKHIVNQIYDLLDVLAHDPIPRDSFDVGRIKGEGDIYRVRLGDVRVVYTVDMVGEI